MREIADIDGFNDFLGKLVAAANAEGKNPKDLADGDVIRWRDRLRITESGAGPVWSYADDTSGVPTMRLADLLYWCLRLGTVPHVDSETVAEPITVDHFANFARTAAINAGR